MDLRVNSRSGLECAMPGSNQRHPACKAGAKRSHSRDSERRSQVVARNAAQICPSLRARPTSHCSSWVDQRGEHAVDPRHQRCTLRRIAPSLQASLSTVGRALKTIGLGRLRNLEPRPPLRRASRSPASSAGALRAGSSPASIGCASGTAARAPSCTTVNAYSSGWRYSLPVVLNRWSRWWAERHWALLLPRKSAPGRARRNFVQESRCVSRPGRRTREQLS